MNKLTFSGGIMTEKDNGKGNLLITYLFTEDDNAIRNLDLENVMKNELQQLAENWKKRGIIKRYMIGDDAIINEKLTR